jgi:glutamate/tyrosine decarboxylase-like PLP-dependent enzyme
MTNRFLDEALLARAHAHAADFLRTLPDRPVVARATRSEIVEALNVPLSQDGEDAASVIDAVASQADRATIASAGPRYFGFVIGGSLPVALAADWLTSAWDQNAGIYVTSPMASVIEEVAGRWLLELFGLPADASVGFVTGGQMANFTALAAARHEVLRRVGWDVEADGLPGAPRVHVITGAESHATIDVSLRYLGFGTRTLLRVEADAQGRMRPDRLHRLLENLSGPAIVCAQAGNVNSGSFDPVGELAAITNEHKAWLHVDGAFGLWARASHKLAPLAAGLEMADSWSTDAHKWLNVPYDGGIVMTRHPRSHRAAMTSTAAYIEHTTGAERDGIDWAPEYSRRARGITIYAALRALGRSGVEALIDRTCTQARQMAHLLSREEGVAVLNDVALNQVLVRFGDDDAATKEVVTRVQQDGTCWLGGSKWQGKGVMRISFSNWATSEEDVERSAAAILRAWAATRVPQSA